jgi:hypothetical protein
MVKRLRKTSVSLGESLLFISVDLLWWVTATKWNPQKAINVDHVISVSCTNIFMNQDSRLPSTSLLHENDQKYVFLFWLR